MKISRISIKGLKPRKAAWEVLQAVSAGSYSDIAIKRVFKKTDLSVIDRGLVTELSYGAIRQRYILDCWIDYLGKIPALKQPPLLRWLLHIGLYQILFMDRIPNSAVVNTTVELAKNYGLAKLSKVTNGILRSAIRAKESGIVLPNPTLLHERIAQAQSIPNWLAKNLLDWTGIAKAELIARSLNKVPQIDIRINKLRANLDDVRDSFNALGIKSFLIENCPYGLEIESSSGDIKDWPGYQEGKWFVQDRAAQWISTLLDPLPGERVLDACSAPGGKTTHLAELMGDFGEVWAVDRSEKRLNQVRSNAQRMKLNSINFVKADASKLLKERPSWLGYFHRILLDAPCSGLGTLGRNPDARWRISPEMISDLVLLQSRLLESLLPLLADGGTLVYSTCTFNPKENTEQIESFIANHPCLTLENQKQIWPGLNNAGDGFYGAVICYNK